MPRNAGGIMLGSLAAIAPGDELSPTSSALQGMAKLRRSEVTCHKRIGEGAFGEVSQATVGMGTGGCIACVSATALELGIV